MTARKDPIMAMAIPSMQKPDKASPEKMPQTTGIITPVALIGAKMDMVPSARLRYSRNMAAIPIKPAGMAQKSRGSRGKGMPLDTRIPIRTKIPVSVEINKIISVGRLRLLRPPIKSAMPQPKQAIMDNVTGSTIIVSF